MKYLIQIFIFIWLGVIFYIPDTNLHNDKYVNELIRSTRILGNKDNIIKKSKQELLNFEKAVRCMAYNIYYEARGEPFLGQVAVARVVMNRVRDHRFPNSICAVVYQKTKVIDTQENQEKIVCQFSWVCENNAKPNTSSKSYKQAIEIAKKVIINNIWSGLLTDDTLYFHSNYVNPNWGLEHVVTIGNHKFFNDKKNKKNGLTKNQN